MISGISEQVQSWRGITIMKLEVFLEKSCTAIVGQLSAEADFCNSWMLGYDRQKLLQ